MKHLIFLGIFLSATLAQAKTFEPYHEIARYKLGGEGSWDWLTVDEAGERLYIARSNRVMVVDTTSGKLIGEVPETEGTHGIALVPKLNLGFATAGKTNSVTVFDLKTLKKLSQIAVGEKPDAILYDSSSDKVFAFNGKSKTASVIDPGSQKIVATVPLPGKPEFAVSDESGTVFVNLEDTSSLAAIDSKKFKVDHTYLLKPCEEPSGLSIDNLSHRLFVGCGNKTAAVVDANSGKVLKAFTVGGGVDAAAFDSTRKLAFISAGEGRLSIIREFELVQDLATQKGARTVASNAKTGKVFLVTAEYGALEAPKDGEKKARPSMVPGSFVVIVFGQN